MKQHAIDAAKLSPPAGVSGMVIAGIPLSDFALLLTIVYTVICIVDKIWPGFIRKLATCAWRKFREVLNV